MSFDNADAVAKAISEKVCIPCALLNCLARSTVVLAVIQSGTDSRTVGLCGLNRNCEMFHEVV